MITIRLVSMEDIPRIQSIAHETWMYTYGSIYSKEFIQRFLSKAYSTENLSRSVERTLQSNQRNFLIAEWNREVVGYAQTHQVNEEKVELSRIYVRPDCHKLGIGNAFIQEFAHTLKPMKILFAWVGKDNSIGRAFYEKRGFVETEEMVETIGGHEKTQIKYELKL